jgi:hypothetical protein
MQILTSCASGIRGMVLLTTTSPRCQKWTVNLFAARVDLLCDRGDFRGPGDQACAAKRSYSAWAALRFLGPVLRLPLRAATPSEASNAASGPPVVAPSPFRRLLSSGCGDDQALAGWSRRDDPSGPQFQLRGRGRRLVSNGVDGPIPNPMASLRIAADGGGRDQFKLFSSRKRRRQSGRSLRQAKVTVSNFWK